MNRRLLVLGSGAVTLAGLAAPAALHAQAVRAKRLGVLALAPGADPGYLEGQMKARGWEIGRDLVIIRRFANGDPSRLPALAHELVTEGVDVILAVGDTPAVAAAKATSSIPIVMQGLYPVEMGLAKSLARPGGNVTGLVYQAQDYLGKLLDVLRAFQPCLKRVGYTLNTASQGGAMFLRRFIEIAEPIGVSVIAIPYPFVVADLDHTLAAAERERVQAVGFGPNHALRGAGWQRIRAWAVRNKVMTFAPPEFREMTLGFGTSMEHFNKLWFDMLDRVLRGTNPADTPIQQPTRFEIVVHRGQLREMGLNVPQTVLIQATEVID
jgi:putative tryptophan/tyrosine transport system substrate-binding protein